MLLNTRTYLRKKHHFKFSFLKARMLLRKNRNIPALLPARSMQTGSRVEQFKNSDQSSCCFQVDLYYQGYLVEFWWNALHKMTSNCDWPIAFMQWLKMLKLSSPSTCLSVVLNLDVNKKIRDWIGEDLCLIVTILPRWTLECPSPMCFSTTAPEPSSPSETRICMVVPCAPRSYVVLILFTVGLPPVHSVSVWEL